MKLRAFPSEIHKSLKLVRTAWSWESAAVSIARTHSAAFSQGSAAGMIASRFGADSTGLMELSSTRFDKRQKIRKPARCQRTRVSGRMIVMVFRTDGNHL